MGWLRDKITVIREQLGYTPEADALVQDAEDRAMTEGEGDYTPEADALVQDAEAQAMTEGEGDYHPPAARNVTARARYDSDAGLA
jgi:hypothetical protein